MKIHPNWRIKDEEIRGLPHISNVLSRPLEYYKKRIQKIGFLGKNTRLLDAACGSGVWAIASSYLNLEVFGIDSTEKYLSVAQKIKKSLSAKGRSASGGKIDNLKLKIGHLEHLPYPDKYFDYVVCYNAWMYTDRLKSLAEMFRVLKPGGKIYLGCIAGLGYYLMLTLQGVKEGNRSLFFTALRAIWDKIYMTEKESRDLLEKQGFKILGLAGAGMLGEPKVKIEPDFQIKKIGFWYIYEILAEKI